MRLRFVMTLCSCLVAAAASPTRAAESEYPTRPVRIVVPFPAGGPTDVLARFLGQHFSQQWNQGVVIENRAGANSAIGAQVVARAAPDGYTLLMAMDTTLVLNPLVTTQLQYKLEDFTLVTLAAVNTSILVVPANGPRTVQELVEKARAQPGKLNYGAGIVPTRLAAFLFNKSFGIEATFVPYKGSSDVVQGLLDGSIDYAVDGIAPHLALVQEGRFRALAKLNDRPLASLPEVKSLRAATGKDELGEMSTWVGLTGPAGLPRAIVDKLHKATIAATQDKEIERKLLPLGIVATTSTPEEFARFVREEKEKWSPLVAESGIVVN